MGNKGGFSFGPKPLVFWEVDGHSSEPKVTEAKTLDLSKPCVIFFGGAAYQARDPQVVAQQYTANSALFDAPTLFQNVNYYSVTTPSKDKEAIRQIGIDNQNYNSAPLHFACDDMTRIVHDYFGPHIPDMKTLEGPQRDAALETMAKEFGNVTLLGFSYGSVMIQQMRNALNDVLTRHGVTRTETGPLLARIGVVNLGPSFEYIDKPHDFSQVTYLSTDDLASVRETKLHDNDKFTEGTRDMQWFQQNHHTIVRTAAPPKMRGISFINKSREDKSSPNDEYTPVPFERETDAHNKSLVTTNFAAQITPGEVFYTIPTNAIGLHARKVLNALLDGSIEATRSGNARDTDTILADYRAKSLTPEAIRGTMTELQFYANLHANVTNSR